MELNQELLERIKCVFSSLKSKNICLIHDTDADGLSSAVLVTKALEKIGIDVKLSITEVSRSEFFSLGNLKKIKDNNINFIICVDVGLEGANLMNHYNILLSQGTDFLIFDHHEYTAELNNARSTYIHPITLIGKESAALCTSKLVYDVLSTFIDLNKYDWIKCIGLLGDMAFLEFPEEVQKIVNKYESKIVNIKSNDDYFKTIIGNCLQIDLARSLGESKYVLESYKLLVKAETPQELIELIGANQDLKEASETINYYTTNFEKLLEKTGEIYWLEIKSKYKLNSPISTIISQRKPDITFITYQKIGPYYGLSARRQDLKYSMRDLLSRSTEGLKDANGGGHIPASGGRIRTEDFYTFKNNILKNHEGCRLK